MSGYCTIYSPAVNFSTAVEVVRNTILDGKIEIVGSEAQWQKIIVKGHDWTFTLSTIQRDKPGDEFLKLILGTLTFFRNVETTALENKQKVVKLISATRWAIGVVAEPGFVDEAGHFDCIFGITERLEGLIFNGWGMVDANGLMVLDKDGNFDES